MARQSEAHESSSSAKARTAKHSRTTHAKNVTAKRKASGKTTRARTADKKLRDTGDIDVNGTAWKDLPPVELPTNDDEDSGDEPTR
jgi:hypothetical protein